MKFCHRRQEVGSQAPRWDLGLDSYSSKTRGRFPSFFGRSRLEQPRIAHRREKLGPTTHFSRDRRHDGSREIRRFSPRRFLADAQRGFLSDLTTHSAGQSRDSLSEHWCAVQYTIFWARSFAPTLPLRRRFRPDALARRFRPDALARAVASDARIPGAGFASEAGLCSQLLASL